MFAWFRAGTLRIAAWLERVALRLIVASLAIVVSYGFALRTIHATDPIGILVNWMLSNARPSLDRELPQTARSVPYSSGDVQILGGQGKGLDCSVPPEVEGLAFHANLRQAPISLQMRQACAFHDYCYRHGAATYGYTQADCDYLLLEHAFRICRYI